MTSVTVVLVATAGVSISTLALPGAFTTSKQPESTVTTQGLVSRSSLPSMRWR